MNEHTTNEPTTANSGRESDGRFAKGNCGGPGNPFARKVAAFRAALMEAVTEQDIKDIAAKLRDDAKAGDKAAIKLLFQYVIGKPQPAVDPDALDVQEMRGYAAGSFSPEMLVEMQRACPLPLLLKLWPIYLAAQEERMAEHLGQQWDKRDEKACRRQERARQKAERKQRRQEARQQASKPHPQPTVAAAVPDVPPSSNGHHGGNGFTNGDNAPSPNGDGGENPLEMILNWLRRHRGSSNGNART